MILRPLPLSLRRPLLFAALLWAPAIVPGQAGGEPATGAPTHAGAAHVLLVFDAGDPAQLARAILLDRHLRDLPAVAWTAVTDGVTPHVSTTTVDEALADPTLSPAAARWLHTQATDPARQADWLLVQSAGATADGPGRAAGRLLAGAGLLVEGALAGRPEGAATDVGVTTWGKVKDLFR